MLNRFCRSKRVVHSVHLVQRWLVLLCGNRRKLHKPSHYSVGLHHLWRRHLLWVCLHRWAQPHMWKWSTGKNSTRRALNLHIPGIYSMTLFHIIYRVWRFMLTSMEDSSRWPEVRMLASTRYASYYCFIVLLLSLFHETKIPLAEKWYFAINEDLFVL